MEVNFEFIKVCFYLEDWLQELHSSTQEIWTVTCDVLKALQAWEDEGGGVGGAGYKKILGKKNWGC